jgi:hypothetical protein
MQTLKNIISAIIGYNSSSENPTATSARFSGIIISILSGIIVVATALGIHLPYMPSQVEAIAGMFGIMFGFIYWLYGLIRAISNAIKTKNLGALYGQPKI